jgi:hypothetical protein
LFIFADAPNELKSDDKEKCKQVVKVIEDLKLEKYFNKVTVITAEKHKGLANSVIEGVTKVLDEYGKVIVMEDDLVSSPYFLKYMNEALDYYGSDSAIWSVSGWSETIKSTKNYKHDIYPTYRASSWGWGTWKDRWDTINWNISDYKKLLSDKKVKQRFIRGGGDMLGMLKRQLEGKSDSWAVRWVYSQSVQDKVTIYPTNSYMYSIGEDGSGTHCGYDKDSRGQNSSTLDKSKKNVKFEKVKIDRKIERELYYLYTDTLEKKIKRNLNAKGIRKILKRIFSGEGTQ